jgi:hypothetical protein
MTIKIKIEDLLGRVDIYSQIMLYINEISIYHTCKKLAVKKRHLLFKLNPKYSKKYADDALFSAKVKNQFTKTIQ